ncbi:MAG: hypothetical protein KH304_06130 [Clostridium sp.]|nr:hypothetical protein [Clostridium sp.]
MSTKKDCSLPDTTVLRELILNNPELPVLIFCGEESYTGDYGYNQADASKGEIEELILYDDYWMTKDEYGEKLTDEFGDEEEYKDLSNEEFEKMIDKKVEEAEFVKAIVIWVG